MSKSICWKFMSLSSDKCTAECKICKQQLTYNKGTTSNLMRHVKTKHPLEHEKETEQQKKKEPRPGTSNFTSGAVLPALSLQPTLSQTIERTTKYKPDSIKKKELDERVLDLVVMDMQPLSVVEHQGFRNLANALDPKYEIISRKRLSSQLLPQRYLTQKQILMKELSFVEKVSITTDCWTSRANEAYTTITAHFIDSDWILKAPVLTTRSEGKRHTAENLASELIETFKEFGISEKVSTIVTLTDNAKNITNAVTIIAAQHQPCFAHTLNLVVRNSIDSEENVKRLINKVKAIVTYFHSSTVATNKLREVCMNQGSRLHKLKQDVETRWNSTFDMLKSYLAQHEEATTVLCISGKNQLCLDPIDLAAAEEAMKTLEPFYEATTELSSEKHTSLSKIIPMTKILSRFTSRGSSPLSQKLHSNLKYRFESVESKPHLQLATLLDPRFKMSGFSNKSSAETAVESLKAKTEGICLSNNSSVSEDTLVPPPPKKPSLLWADFDEEIVQNQLSTALPRSAADVEISLYLETQPISRDRDVLKWWRENAGMFPRLQALSKEVLAIPATSVPSERVFSKAGELISQRRANLKKNNVDMIVFLNKSST